MRSSERDTVVLVSGFGDDGRGGVFALTDAGVEILDSVPTVGLAYDGRRDRLARLPRAPGEVSSTAELIVYDERGVLEYRRLDAVRDPHDVIADGDAWVVVSTGNNEIVRVERDGAVQCLWHGAGETDAWHVNCVTTDGIDLWASAFGEFATFKGWRGRNAVGHGRLWNLRTSETFGGLTHPHAPRPLDGEWVVCESLDGVITRLDRHGQLLARIPIGGYTRGLATTDDQLLVGVSAPREDATATAHVALLERAKFTIRDRVELPCREIYDIVVVPTALADAVRIGAATNAYRVGTMLTAHVTAGTVADPVADGCRVRVALPDTREAGDRWTVDVEVENTGDSWLGTVEPRPVLVASRWTDGRGTQVDGERMPLPVVLAPGQRTIVALPITAPAAGEYQLTVSLVREGEYWLDAIDAARGVSTNVVVRKPTARG